MTVPGLGRDEGVFLVTAANDGSRVIYFIANNQRHSILTADLELEMRLNPLWPIRMATRDEVLSFAEGAPVGAARAGLLSGSAGVDAAPAADVPAAAPAADPVQDALTAPAPDLAPASEAAAPAVTDDAAQPFVYVLKPGDNLTRISAEYGISIQAILDANGIPNMNRIYVGQPLIIPDVSALQAPDVVEPPAAQPPVAQDAPAADDSADATDVEADAPASDAATADQPETYTVQRGDSAIQIAKRFGVDEAALLGANAIANPNRVYVGQVLNIPQ